MNIFRAVHVKLIARDFLSLTVHNPPNYAPTFFRRGLAAKVETEIALREAATDELGKLVRVRGMITLGVGVGLQLTVRDVLVERDPNMETLYWMDCIRLAESCYDHAACP
ncbi:CST complex subunit STN1-like [Zingiber officinale]|uniref:CST complex subunit STN1-like n=1 Tax=Zingiber officinale TaxID=94328 RepID=UPI001C4C61AA|nr:CST complex subunit STN1-like [Zingiber officinale]